MSLCTVSASISSNIDEVLSIKPSANASICFPMAFPLLVNCNHVSVLINFPITPKQVAPFHCMVYDHYLADWDRLCDHLREVPWVDIFKLSASAAASEFCEWVQVGIDVYIPHRKNQVKAHSSPWFSPAYAAAIVHRNHFLEDIFKFGASAAASEFCEWVQIGIDVYIPHRKYQVKLHSSPWFSAACAAAIVHRNHFFHLYQQNKSSKSKVKFRQANNHCKGVLEIAKFPYATKTKEFITSQKLGSRDFWQIANSVLNKGSSAVPLKFNEPEMLPSVVFCT